MIIFMQIVERGMPFCPVVPDTTVAYLFGDTLVASNESIRSGQESYFQSLPITTKNVIYMSAHWDVYSIQH